MTRSIAIVVPTIKGREDYYQRCIESYEKNSTQRIQFITVRDKPCVGTAWNEGASETILRAIGSLDLPDYLHLTNDDITAHPGWDEAAIEATEKHLFPSPQLLNSAGVTEQWGRSLVPLPDYTIVSSTTIPFMKLDLWPKIGPCLDVHYYSDDYLSWRAAQIGIPSAYVEGYKFSHHMAQVGRGAGMSEADRMVHDQRIYLEVLRQHANSSNDDQ